MARAFVALMGTSNLIGNSFPVYRETLRVNGYSYAMHEAGGDATNGIARAVHLAEANPPRPLVFPRRSL